jgi:hypothetical protein
LSFLLEEFGYGVLEKETEQRSQSREERAEWSKDPIAGTIVAGKRKETLFLKCSVFSDSLIFFHGDGGPLFPTQKLLWFPLSPSTSHLVASIFLCVCMYASHVEERRIKEEKRARARVCV